MAKRNTQAGPSVLSKIKVWFFLRFVYHFVYKKYKVVQMKNMILANDDGLYEYWTTEPNCFKQFLLWDGMSEFCELVLTKQATDGR